MVGCKVRDCPWHREHHELCSKDVIVVGMDGICSELSNGKGILVSKTELKNRYDEEQKLKKTRTEAKNVPQ